jgi:hypothetical protein
VPLRFSDTSKTNKTKTELLDSFTDKESNVPELLAPANPAANEIGFRNATFAWSSEKVDGTLTPSKRKFTLKIEGELLFKRGCINLVVGATGSVREDCNFSQTCSAVFVGQNLSLDGSPRSALSHFRCTAPNPLIRRNALCAIWPHFVVQFASRQWYLIRCPG